MLMTCFTYIQFFIKRFHWMVQFSTENKTFSIFKQSDIALISASMSNRTNIIGSLFYLLQGILSPASSFRPFLEPRFWYSLSISGFSWNLILFYWICKAIFSIDLLFFISYLFFTNFLVTWFFIHCFNFRVFLVSAFFAAVAIHDFSYTLLSYIQYLIFDFQYIFLLYTVLQNVYYHRISFLLSVLSCLDFYYISFFEDSNLSVALLAIQ